MSATENRSLGTEGFERREIDLHGVKTVYYEAGEGPVVIYFHGGGAFHGIQFARPWTKKFRVICPYHTGFAESGDDPRIGAMQHYVLHYLDFLDALKITDKFHLTGLSMGGRLAAEFAVGYAERLKSLVIGAPAGLNIPEHPAYNLGAVSMEEMMRHLVTDIAVLEPYIPPAIPEEDFLQSRVREAQMASKAMMSSTGLDHWMHRITVPTLLLWGENDRILPVGRAKAWEERLPNGTVKIIPTIGHLIFDESPEAVRIAEEFMEKA